MSFALSFADEFFWGDDEIPPETLLPSSQPTSVYQAILSPTDHEWAELARDVFGVAPVYLDYATVIAKVRETNTCRNLESPVEIFIDREGWYTHLIYESSKEVLTWDETQTFCRLPARHSQRRDGTISACKIISPRFRRCKTAHPSRPTSPVHGACRAAV